jgi:DNA-binding NarL/FixJ family response regulator
MNQAILEAYGRGQSLRQIAAEHSLSVTKVHSILVSHGEPRRRVGYQRRPRTEALAKRDATIVAMYRAGQSTHGVARVLHISAATVWKVLERHNEPRWQRGRQQ